MSKQTASEMNFESSKGPLGLNWEQHYQPILKYIGLALVMFWMVMPLYFVFQNSLKSPDLIFRHPVGIPWVTFDPVPWAEMAWNTLWDQFPFVQYLMASTIAAVGTAGLATFAAVLAAYAFARLDFPQKERMFMLVVAGFLIPFVLLTIPVFVLLQNLGFLNTYLGLIVAFTSFTLPYNVWLLRGFFEDLPENLEESARVDGCTQVGAFFRVILPLSRPAIASVFLLAFLLAWHNFTMAVVIGSDPLHKTLPVAILQLRSTFFVRNIHFIMVATFLTMAIPIVMYMYLQKYLVEGLSASTGVKG